MKDIQEEIVRHLFDDVEDIPSDWQKATMRARCTWAVSEFDLVLSTLNPDAPTQWAEVSGESSEKFLLLRDRMADENGAWYSAEVQVECSGRYEFRFDYDSEPEWDSKPYRETLEEDLRRYPRPVNLIPSWHPSFQGEVPVMAELPRFEALAAIAVYDAALPTQGWDKATLRAEDFLTDKPTASVDCNRGLSVINTIQLTNSGMAPILNLHREMKAAGRLWNSMTLWLEASDGSFTTSYE